MTMTRRILGLKISIWKSHLPFSSFSGSFTLSYDTGHYYPHSTKNASNLI